MRTAALLVSVARLRRAGLIGLLVWLCCAVPCGAHPMGNFSVGHYTSLRLDGPQVSVRYRLDLAEIPTVELLRQIETDADGNPTVAGQRTYLARQVPELTAAQHFRLNGIEVTPTVLHSDLLERAGAGNLATAWITIDYSLPLPTRSGSVRLDYEDDTYPKRRGWREVVAQAKSPASIAEADVPAADRSRALEQYPADLSSPPDVRHAHIVFRRGEGAALPTTQPTATAGPSPGNTATPRDGFTALINAKSLTTTVVLSSLAIAFALGCAHALSPGHGKTVVAAYLVGSRGTVSHAMLLGAVVTATHVAGVFALGLVVLFASSYVIPERIYPWLGFASGLLIACMGLWQFTRRYAVLVTRRAGVGHFHDGHFHVHAADGRLHAHEHHHGPGGHTHDMPDRITPGSLIAMGVSGGIVPCPSALIVLLAAIALNRTAFGLVLIVAFSLGLAAVLIAIGVVMLRARRLFDRFQPNGRWLPRLPIASSLVVAVLGCGIAVQSLLAGGVLRFNP